MKVVHLTGTILCALLCIFTTSTIAQTSNNTSPLGKTDIHALLEAAPAVPATPQVAVTRAYGEDMVSPDPLRLQRYYEPLQEKILAAQKKFEDYSLQVQARQQAMSPDAVQKILKQPANPNAVQHAQQIQLAMSEIFARMEQLTEEYREKVKGLATEPGCFDELEAAYKQAYAEIPLVVMGEGRDKDPKAVRELILKDVELKRKRNAAELEKKAAWFTDLKAKYKLVVNDFKDLLAKHKGNINSSVEGMLNGTNTEMGLIQFEMSLMDLAARLGKISEEATEIAARIDREQFFRTRL
ncbi:MAG: hypothetical protein J7578_02845 [Chitinophagaceae bacterium]|nr:hypothetical protein [Chitinophagaceae bacterium]